MAEVSVARVYDVPRRTGDEYRVLVDRLWPRGVKKEALDLDEWAKEVAPSSELRRWYGHVPERFDEFERRYRRELAGAASGAARAALTEHARLVLLTATRDVEHSGAEVLRRALLAGG